MNRFTRLICVCAAALLVCAVALARPANADVMADAKIEAALVDEGLWWRSVSDLEDGINTFTEYADVMYDARANASRLRMAAAAGDPAAMSELYMLIRDNPSLEKRPGEAFNMLKKAVEANDPMACHEYYYVLLAGKNFKKANDFHAKCRESGQIWAKLHISFIESSECEWCKYNDVMAPEARRAILDSADKAYHEYYHMLLDENELVKADRLLTQARSRWWSIDHRLNPQRECSLDDAEHKRARRALLREKSAAEKKFVASLRRTAAAGDPGAMYTLYLKIKDAPALEERPGEALKLLEEAAESDDYARHEYYHMLLEEDELVKAAKLLKESRGQEWTSLHKWDQRRECHLGDAEQKQARRALLRSAGKLRGEPVAAVARRPSAKSPVGKKAPAAPASFEEGVRAMNYGEYDRAKAIFTAQAEKGSARAAMLLGTLYDDEMYGHPDPREAAVWYRKAAAAGNSQAMWRLYEMIKADPSAEESPGEALDLLKNAAEANDANACHEYYHMLRESERYGEAEIFRKKCINIDFPQPWVKDAPRCCHDDIENRNARRALLRSASVRSPGTIDEGVQARKDGNFDLARIIFTWHAEKKGSRRAMRELGHLYDWRYIDSLENQNSSKAVSWYRKAALAGDWRAMEDMYWLMRKEPVLQSTPGEAFYLLRMVANYWGEEAELACHEWYHLALLAASPDQAAAFAKKCAGFKKKQLWAAFLSNGMSCCVFPDEKDDEPRHRVLDSAEYHFEKVGADKFNDAFAMYEKAFSTNKKTAVVSAESGTPSVAANNTGTDVPAAAAAANKSGVPARIVASGTETAAAANNARPAAKTAAGSAGRVSAAPAKDDSPAVAAKDIPPAASAVNKTAAVAPTIPAVAANNTNTAAAAVNKARPPASTAASSIDTTAVAAKESRRNVTAANKPRPTAAAANNARPAIVASGTERTAVTVTPRDIAHPVRFVAVPTIPSNYSLPTVAAVSASRPAAVVTSAKDDSPIVAAGNAVPAAVASVEAARPVRQTAAPAALSEGMKAWSHGEYERAERIFTENAERGDVKAMQMLGSVYKTGWYGSASRDPKKSARWYRRAVAAGDRTCMYDLYEMLKTDPSLEERPGEALSLLKQAAAQNDVFACQEYYRVLLAAHKEDEASALLKRCAADKQTWAILTPESGGVSRRDQSRPADSPAARSKRKKGTKK